MDPANGKQVDGPVSESDYGEWRVLGRLVV